MKRRTFIQLSSFTAIAIGTYQLTGCKPSQQKIALSKPGFILKFIEEDSLRQAGADYIKQFPKENDEEVIIRALMEGIDSDPSNTTAIEATLDKKIQQDFDKGSTVVVNGWILALTEARQCALFSLS